MMATLLFALDYGQFGFNVCSVARCNVVGINHHIESYYTNALISKLFRHEGCNVGLPIRWIGYMYCY